MVMSISNNVGSLNAQRHVYKAQSQLQQSMSKLSSGTRIPRAKDDSAGLGISEKLRGEIRGLNQAARNSQDGVNMIQTAEGALEEVHSMLQRMRELAVQASNDTLDTTDRGFINDELQELQSQVDMIADTTEYNGKNLANGTLSTAIDATTEFGTGSVVQASSDTSVSSLDVTNASNPLTAAKTYRFTFVSASNTLTLTNQAAGMGADTETIVLTDVNADSTNTVNFAKLGISFDVSSVTGLTSELQGASMVATKNDDIIIAGATVADQGSATFQTGADATQELSVAFHNVRISDSGGTGSSDSRVTGLKAALSAFAGGKTQANASSLITNVDNAIEFISEKRSYYGSKQNRLEHTINNLQQTAENLTASESRIRDVDVAAESANMAKQAVLQQAAVSVLAQANAAPQLALKLLA